MNKYLGALCTLALLAFCCPIYSRKEVSLPKPVDPPVQAPATPPQLLR
jgi:hypothetical protein